MNTLTEREIKIIVLICQEHTNAEISEMLSIKIRTLEWIRANIMVKTKTKNSIGLFKYAIKKKLYKLT